MNIVTYSPLPWGVPDTKLELGQHQLVRLVGEVGFMVRKVTANKPDLVFLAGFEPAEPHYIEEVEKLCLALPHAAIVALHPQTEPKFLLSLMRAGVREVIVDSASETLQKVIERIHLRTKGASISLGRVFGFVSSKGGDGSTCIAASLAVALSLKSLKPACLRSMSICLLAILTCTSPEITTLKIWLTSPVDQNGLTSRCSTAWCSTSAPSSTSSHRQPRSKKSFKSNPRT